MGGRRDRLRNTKVGDDGGVARKENVVRLDIAMHHAAFMRVGQCARDIAQDAEHFRNGDWSASQPRAEALAFHIRHGVVRNAVDVTGCEYRYDVGLL